NEACRTSTEGGRSPAWAGPAGYGPNRVEIVIGLIETGRPPGNERAIRTTSPTPTRFSTIDASSAAWIVGLTANVTAEIAGSDGRSRLMSLKFWLVPPANDAPPTPGSRCSRTSRTTAAGVKLATELNPPLAR